MLYITGMYGSVLFFKIYFVSLLTLLSTFVLLLWEIPHQSTQTWIFSFSAKCCIACFWCPVWNLSDAPTYPNGRKLETVSAFDCTPDVTKPYGSSLLLPHLIWFTSLIDWKQMYSKLKVLYLNADQVSCTLSCVSFVMLTCFFFKPHRRTYQSFNRCLGTN